MEATTDSQKRAYYLDYLRVVATIATITIHVSAQNWYGADVNGHAWRVFNFYDSIARWPVPIFVMISGALFLRRDLSIKVLLSKYICRLITAYLVWSAIYAPPRELLSLHGLVLLMGGHYHMWFIPMIAGLYLCQPLLRTIAKEPNQLKLFLVLAFVFSFVFPTLTSLSGDFCGGRITTATDALNGVLDNMQIQLIAGYSGYFMLGYYLSTTELSRRVRRIVYLLGIGGAAATVLLSLLVSIKTQTQSGHYYGNFTANNLLMAIAIFIFFKQIINGRKLAKIKLDSFISKLSKYSFGAYLVHAWMIEHLAANVGVNTLSFEPILSVPAIVLMVFAASSVVSAALNHIPIIKKYAV